MVPVSEVPLLYEVGTNVQPPYQSISDFQFSSGTLKHLKQFGHDQLTSLDYAVGANIAVGNDCVIVADDDKDKEVEKRVRAYAFPILKDLSKKPLDGPSVKGKEVIGCEVLIICASKTSARHRARVITFLLDCLRPCFGSSVKTEVEYCNVLNIICKRKPNILILDIESLMSMRGVPKASYFFARLKYLVFEEQELYSEEHLDEIPDLIAIAEQHNEQCCNSPFTTVFATSQWTAYMEKTFVDIRNNNNRNIVAYFYLMPELVKFANVKWNLTLAADEESGDDAKIRLLKDTLSKGLGALHTKVAICCSALEKADFIRNVCIGMGLNAKIAGCPHNAADLGFSSNGPEIVIISDQYKRSSAKNDCTYLIGIDGDSMKQVQYLASFFPRLNPETNQIEKNDLVATFFMTGKESYYLPLYKFSKCMNNVVIAAELKKLGDTMISQELYSMPLCSGIKLFGYCNNWNSSKCQLRHELNEGDVPAQSVVPSYGKIEYKVIRCKSPSEYTGLLLNYRMSSSDPIQRSYTQEREEYVEELNKVAAEGQLEKPLRLENGQTYAVLRNPNKYIPATLVLRPCDSVDSKYVYFDCLVTGERFGLSVANNIFLIPAALSCLERPPPIVTIIFCGVRPFGGIEMEYSAKEVSIAQNLTKDRSYKAYVGLSIGSTIWAKAIVYGKTDDSAKDGCLRTLMQSKEIVSLNQTHLGKLIHLMRQLGADYPEHMTLCRFDNPTNKIYHNYGDPIQWRHVEISTVDFIKLTEIKVTYIYDPYLFYGVCTEFEQLLNNLEEELTKWCCDPFIYEKYGVSKIKYFERTLKVGTVIGVKLRNEDNKEYSWKRGLVTDIQKTDSNSMCEVFLVDFGETLNDVPKEDIVPIPKKLVHLLPFQAIAFSLEHIKPKGEEIEAWDHIAKEKFWEMMIPDGYNTCFKAVATKDVTDDQLDCRSYHVIGIYRDQEIGEMLISKNVAVQKMDIKEWMDGIVKAKNQAVLNMLENEGEDSSEEFFDALDNLEDFDVNLEANRVYGAHSLQESIAQLQEKIKEIKTQRARAILTSNHNSDKCTNAPKGIFSASAQNRVSEISPSATSFFSSKKLLRTKKKQQSSSTQPLSQGPSLLQQGPKTRYPEVLWHQTQTQVILTVMVPDVKESEFSLKIENRNIVTMQVAKSQEESYRFQIQLLGKVVGWTMKLSGYQLIIYLDKLNPSNEGWPRLLSDKKLKFRWLKFNKNYIQENVEGCKDEDAIVPMHGVGVVDNVEDGDDNDENLDEIEEDKYFRASPKFSLPHSADILMEEDDL